MSCFVGTEDIEVLEPDNLIEDTFSLCPKVEFVLGPAVG